MRLIGHLVRSDVRQFRWLILGWLLLVTAAAVLTVSRPGFSDVRVYANVSMILGLLWSARQLAMLLIVPLVIQAHPAVGTDAFWMTRPIPPAALFASKALVLVTLLIVVSFAVDVAALLWIQVPLRQALFVATDSAITSGAWTGVLIAGAVVTLNLPRFALLCGAAFLSLMVLFTGLLMVARPDDVTETTTLVVGGSAQALPPPQDPTSALLLLAGITVAGLVVAALQYRTRRRLASVPIGVGIIALLVFGLPHWPFPWLRVPSNLPEWAHDAGRVQLHMPSPAIEMFAMQGWMDGGRTLRTGSTLVTVSGLEPGWLPRLVLRDASVTLDNGTTLTSRGRGSESSPQIDGSPGNPARVVARQALGVGQVLLSAPPTSNLSMTLSLPADAIDPLMPASAVYRGQFAVHLVHWEVAAALPLRSGSVFHDVTYRFAIEQVTRGPGTQLVIRAREWRANSSFDRAPAIAYGFYIRDAQHAHAIAGNASEPFGGMDGISFGLPFTATSSHDSSVVHTSFVSFPPYGPQQDDETWDPAWYANAELVIVRMTESGAVPRTLEVPRASIVAKQ